MMDDDDEGKDDGPGLIKLDMKSMGSGSMEDPLRHAMGMRNAQDQCKMRMWNSFPSLFQNTIFHGEQDPEIKLLRHEKSLAERLSRAKQLKEDGNTALKAASSQITPVVPSKAAPSQQEQALSEKVHHLSAAVASKEQELKALRQELNTAKAELERVRSDREAPPPEQTLALETNRKAKDGLDAAIANYEKAAGLLRYVECTRPSWKNDDGSYKGIEDQWLTVDASAIEGDAPDAEEARELVSSCYLNIALASQKLEDFDKMRKACDEVLLHVNAKNVKALYRRAQARMAPVSALDEDRVAAIQDLHAAAQLAPQDKDVRGLLAKLKAAKKAQEVNDRSTFAGMFDRGEVVTNDPRTEGDKPKALDLQDPKVQAMLDIHPGPRRT